MNNPSPNPTLVGVDVSQVDLGLFESVRDIYILLLQGLNGWSDPYKARKVLNKSGTADLIKQVVLLCGSQISEPATAKLEDVLSAAHLAKTLFLSDDVRESHGSEWFERLRRTADYIAEGKGIWEKIEEVVAGGVKGDLDRFDGCREDVLTIKPSSFNKAEKQKQPVVLRTQVNSEFPDRYLAGLGLPSTSALIHVKSREMIQMILNSYSGASIADGGKVKRPFHTGVMSLPGKWVSTGGLYSISSQKQCFRLLAKAEFQQRHPDIEPLPYREHWDNRSRVKCNGGYHGMLVLWGKKEVVLTGPPITFWWLSDSPYHNKEIRRLSVKYGVALPEFLKDKLEAVQPDSDATQLSLF